jgi:hypothetical protein
MEARRRPAVQSRVQSRWAWLFPLLTATALMGVGALPSAANAAPSKFVYELCDSALPGGNSPPASFVVNPGVPLTPFNTCAQPGGAIGITETGPTAATFAYWSVGVPNTPGGFVESVTLSAAAGGLGPGNDHTFAYESGWPANNNGESRRIFGVASAPGFLSSGGGFNILMNCNGNYAPGCSAGPTVWAHYIAATEVDLKPPTLSAPQGSLLAGGVLRGHQELGAEATDEGGGLGKVEISVNGLPAGQPSVANCNLARVKNPSYEGTVAVSVTPCPAKLKGSWVLNTAAFPFHDGANTVEVCATDFSTLTEPNKSCSAPATVTVNNSCTESPVVGGQVISAQFAGTHDEQITVPYDHAAKVTGELADTAGDTIAGATICVQMQTEGSHRGLHPVAAVRTDANGRFTYKVPAGPNRKVLLGYRHDSFQVARAIRYYARARPTIHLSRGSVGAGGVIRIAGKVPGRRGGGRVVVLQASALHSRRWFTFLHATTSPEGRFHSRYRFDATTRTTTYRIRAVVPRQHGYPWEAGHSTPALVVVRG